MNVWMLWSYRMSIAIQKFYFWCIPAGIYLLKVNNRNTRARCEACSKLTIKIPERRHWLNRLAIWSSNDFLHISFHFSGFSWPENSFIVIEIVAVTSAAEKQSQKLLFRNKLEYAHKNLRDWVTLRKLHAGAFTCSFIKK